MEKIIEFLTVLFLSYFRYFLVAGLVFFVLYKVLAPRLKHIKIQQVDAKKSDFLREISNSVIVSAIAASVAFTFLFTDIVNFSKVYTDVNDYPIWWIPLSFVISLFVHDTYFYWMHKTLHHPKLYKITHLEHHKSVNPSPWASYSFNIIEGFLEVMIVPILIFLMPVHFSVLFMFSVAILLINVYGHCGYELMPKSFRKTWLFEVVATSTYHNLHHEKFNYNFSLYFRIWDRLMGTEYPKYVEVYDKLLSRKNEHFQVKVVDLAE